MLNQALAVSVYDASQIRLTEMADAYDRAIKAGDETEGRRVLDAAIDLALGNEHLARSTGQSVADARIIGAYLMEAYALLAVATDPFLRPMLPVVPTTGATVQRIIVSVNSRAIIANTTLIGMGGVLVPSSTPNVPGPTYHGAVSSATPLAAEVQALTADSWAVAARSVIYNTNGTFPAFAEPQVYGPRLVIKDANSFDITTLLTQSSVSYLINGVAVPYYLYVFNLAQYDPALTVNF